MMYTFKEIKEIYGVNNSKTDDELRKEFSEHFFYPNVCQYCTYYQKKIVVKRCNGCYEMQYCSKNHLGLHWKDHKEFCYCLRKIKADANKEHLFQYYSRNERANLITVAENELKRKLQPCEKQMFLYPKICLVCSESDPGLVKSCPNCPYGNFCDSHVNNEKHKKYCRIFLDAFYLDHYWIVFKDIPWERFIHPLPCNKKVIHLPNCMYDFLKAYIEPFHNLNFEVHEVKALVSTIFTRSLSLIYALQKLKLTLYAGLQVHVISKYKSIEKNFVEWEIILHWLPRLTFLKITFIGCEMSPKIFNVHLCQECTDKTLKIEISDMLYKDYYKKMSKIPDVIVAFDVDDDTLSTWIDSSPLLTNCGSPIVLTGINKFHLNRGARTCVQNPNNFSRIEFNPFKSLKPERYSEEIVFSNYGLIIYGDLFPKICGVDQPIDPCNNCMDCNLRFVNKLINKELYKVQLQHNAALREKAENYMLQIEKMEQAQKNFKENLQDLKETFTRCFSDMENKTLKVVRIF